MVFFVLICRENFTPRQDAHGIQTHDSMVNITTPEEEETVEDEREELYRDIDMESYEVLREKVFR